MSNREWEQAFLEVDAGRKDIKKFARKVSLFALRPEERILDLCCGTGLYARVFQSMGCSRVIGYDISPNLLKHARGIGVVCGDALSVALRPNSIDVVFVAKGLHHFIELEHILAEARRILRPHGRLLFIEPANSFVRRIAHVVVFSPLSRLSSRIASVRRALDQEKATYFNWLSMGRREIATQFESAGFEMSSWHEDHLHSYAEWTLAR